MDYLIEILPALAGGAIALALLLYTELGRRFHRWGCRKADATHAGRDALVLGVIMALAATTFHVVFPPEDPGRLGPLIAAEVAAMGTIAIIWYTGARRYGRRPADDSGRGE